MIGGVNAVAIVRLVLLAFVVGWLLESNARALWHYARTGTILGTHARRMMARGVLAVAAYVILVVLGNAARGFTPPGA
jgi:hydrogenase-4 membrane subunit HyfE